MASEKITALVEEVKTLSVLELAELVHTLEEVFGVSAAAAAVAAPAAGAAAAVEEKTEFDELLNGTTSMACTTGDPIAPARIVSEFAKKNKDVITIKGGMVEGKVLTVDELKAFGELPSKDALVAQVLGTLLAPISSLAFVISQIAEKGGAPVEAAAPAEEAAPAEAPAEEAAPAEAPAEA